MKNVFLYGGVLLNTLIFASSYTLIKETLNRWDCLMFLGLAMVLVALPVGVIIALFTHRLWTRRLLLWALLLAGLFTVTSVALSLALEYTSVAETAFFPSLNGIFAALFLRFVLKKSVSRLTWLMALLAASGMVLLMASAPPTLDHWRGDGMAFLGGVLYVAYIFLVEAFLRESGGSTSQSWTLLGLECLLMSAFAAVLLLLFGDWRAVHPVLPEDLVRLLALGAGVIVLSNIIALFVQAHIDATRISFLAILEPILADLAAVWFLRESYPLLGSIGAALGIVAVAGQALLPSILANFAHFWRARRKDVFLQEKGKTVEMLSLFPIDWIPYRAWERRSSPIAAYSMSSLAKLAFEREQSVYPQTDAHRLYYLPARSQTTPQRRYRPESLASIGANVKEHRTHPVLL